MEKKEEWEEEWGRRIDGTVMSNRWRFVGKWICQPYPNFRCFPTKKWSSAWCVDVSEGKAFYGAIDLARLRAITPRPLKTNADILPLTFFYRNDSGLLKNHLLLGYHLLSFFIVTCHFGCRHLLLLPVFSHCNLHFYCYRHYQRQQHHFIMNYYIYYTTTSNANCKRLDQIYSRYIKTPTRTCIHTMMLFPCLQLSLGSIFIIILTFSL